MQKAPKKVGIVVPIYNVEKYLRQCLESIIHQTYTPLEILLVNDGSTDSSLRIAKEYAQKERRITIIDKENGGSSSARNVGIEFFSGKLLQTFSSLQESANASFCHCEADVYPSSLRGSEVDVSLSRHCEAERSDNEAIHNVSNPKILNSETLDYRLPRFLTESRNDTVAKRNDVVAERKDNLPPRHCEAERSDNEAIHNPAYFKDSIAESKIDNIMDCHEANASRNDVVAERKDAESHTLYSYKINGENPYQIRAIYSLKDKLEIPHIDYLQFIDSDDYIELDCVEACIPRMQGVDVLWFDAKPFLDGVKKSAWKSNLWHFGYTNEVVISRKDWVLRLSQRNLSFFYFSWSGIIDFDFLKRIKLQFINGIIQEDDMFGILLFAQSNSIYVYPKKLYHYRIRANSLMNYGDDFQAKVSGFSAKSAVVFKENYLKRQYHKASSFMQTCLSLDYFLTNTQDERVKHILSAYLMPTYVFYAHKILYFSKDPLNLIPKFQELQEYLKDFKSNALINDSLKDSLTYRLGSASLSLLKNPKKSISLPKTLYLMIQKDKESQKAYKENSKNYQLTLPNFKNLVSKTSEIKIKQHLSYKLGDCILKAHKMRYFGGYLWLPLGLIWIFISFKLSSHQRAMDSILLNSMESLKQEVSHLNLLYSSNPKREDSKFQSLGIPSEFQDIFIQAKDKLVIHYTKDIRFLNLLLECKAKIHHFEADLAFCEILKERYKEAPNVTFYNNALSRVESTQICQRENQGNGICPSVFYANHQLYEAKSLKISEVLQRFSNLYLLVFDLDFETCELVEWLLERQEYQKISYIFCKVDRIFGKSKKFESIKQSIDSAPPPAQFVFYMKRLKKKCKGGYQ